MIRLLISFLCVLGLAFAPVAANAAATPSSGMQSCKMDGKMPAKPVDHAKMDCCTPACQIGSAAALLPQRGLAADQMISRGELHGSFTVKALESLAPTGLDPPPRA